MLNLVSHICVTCRTTGVYLDLFVVGLRSCTYYFVVGWLAARILQNALGGYNDLHSSNHSTTFLIISHPTNAFCRNSVTFVVICVTPGMAVPYGGASTKTNLLIGFGFGYYRSLRAKLVNFRRIIKNKKVLVTKSDRKDH